MASRRGKFHPSKGEIIRASQKDQMYVDTLLTTPLNEIVQLFFGNTVLIRYKEELEVLSHILYFLLTTSAGYQTIGEEYVNLLQVDGQTKIPSHKRRLSLIVLQCVAPYVLRRLLKRAELALEDDQSEALEESNDHASLSVSQSGLVDGYFIRQSRSRSHDETSNNNNQSQSSLSNDSWRQWSRDHRQELLPTLRTLRKLIVGLQRLYLVYFYTRGSVNHAAKWITGVRYLRTRPASPIGDRTYYWLGLLTLLPLSHYMYAVAMEIGEIWSSWQREKTKSALEEPGNSAYDLSTNQQPSVRSSNERCVLCLELADHVTATPCGHVFCWYCIHRWCKVENQCPTCRRRVEPSRLIYLRNLP